MSGTAFLLNDRGVLRVSGPEAADFLQGLLTNDVLGLEGGAARYAGLLSPQGKVLFDFLVVRVASDEPTFLLDCLGTQVADLAKRLGFYKLRSKVVIADISTDFVVLAGFGDAPALPNAFIDPREAKLGWRAIAPKDSVAKLTIEADVSAYEINRIALGVPRGGVDFAYGDAIVHEANFDRLHGVDFKKGCYVGQEIVSRVEHRGTARKRVTRVVFDGPAPAPGTEVFAADIMVGTVGSSAGAQGLAMLRLDKVEGADLKAGGVGVTLV